MLQLLSNERASICNADLPALPFCIFVTALLPVVRRFVYSVVHAVWAACAVLRTWLV